MLAAEMVAGLSAFRNALEAGEPIEKRFSVRTVALNVAQSRNASVRTVSPTPTSRHPAGCASFK